MLPTWIWRGLCPQKCLQCHTEGSWLCDEHYAFQQAPDNEVDYHYLDDIQAVVAYQDPPVQALVEHYKFKGFKQLAPIIAQSMDETVFIKDTTIITPIPLHWRRQLWRGFNQAELIAQHWQKKRPHINIQSYLKRSKPSRQQARLSRVERTQNVADIFMVTSNVNGKHIVLLDDVVASGATLEAAAKTLKRAGAHRVTAIVWARGGKIS